MSLSRIALSSIVVAGLASAASAAYVNATFNGVAPNVNVTVTRDSGANWLGTQAGGFNFTRTGGTATDPYVSGNYISFCIDIFKTVGTGGTYGWNQAPLASAPTGPGGPNYPMGPAKAALLGKLWGAHRSGLSGSVDFGAFQLAVWEIVFEDSGIFDVKAGATEGNFYAINGDANSDSARTLANTWLSTVASEAAYGGVYALTGDTGEFGAGQPQDQLVPTPGSLALCGLGGLVLTRRRR